MGDIVSVSEVRKSMAAMFVVVVLMVGFLTWVAARRDGDIVDNTARIEKIVLAQCADRNTAARGANEILDTLIAAVGKTDSIPDAEKADRIQKYLLAKVPLVNCGP